MLDQIEKCSLSVSEGVFIRAKLFSKGEEEKFGPPHPLQFPLPAMAVASVVVLHPQVFTMGPA